MKNAECADGIAQNKKLSMRSPHVCFFIFHSSFFIFLFGCAVGPNYKRPAVTAPEAFRGEMENSTNSFADLKWWQVFPDEKLQSLIRIALTNNYDLRIAFTRVEQARANVAAARAGFFPQLNYQALVAKGKNVAAGGEPSPNGKTGGEIAFDGSAAWEIDLWGRIRRLNESARAQYFASQDARRDVTISLIVEVAQTYFQLLALDRQLEIARNSTNSFAESLRIFSERLSGGVGSKLETSAAEAAMASAAATIPNLERQIILQENQLSVLLGQNPGPIVRENSALAKESPPDVPAGLPSSLLERRPDIREAEQQLRSANAQVGVATADFFPRLNLSGMAGEASSSLSAITAGGSFAWSAAANLAGPIFRGGQLRAAYARAKAARDEAVLHYQATVLTSFREVSDALVSRQKLAAARDEQAKAVKAYEDAVQIARERYRLGKSSYYEVLQEQQQLFPAQNALVQTQLNQLLSVVQLYRALGGGWHDDAQSH